MALNRMAGVSMAAQVERMICDTAKEGIGASHERSISSILYRKVKTLWPSRR